MEIGYLSILFLYHYIMHIEYLVGCFMMMMVMRLYINVWMQMCVLW